jgi:hypothetical protein
MNWTKCKKIGPDGKKCGESILFITQENGKSLAVNYPGKYYISDYEGEHKLLCGNGTFDYGTITPEYIRGAAYGYIPHYMTCKEKKDAPAHPEKPQEKPGVLSSSEAQKLEQMKARKAQVKDRELPDYYAQISIFPPLPVERRRAWD